MPPRDESSQEALFAFNETPPKRLSEKGHRGDNLLNDLTPKEWLLATKSVWYRRSADLQSPHLEAVASALLQTYGAERTEQIMGQICDSLLVSTPPARDSSKLLHPATFAETDIEKLIRFFSKEGETVLDPFLGSGSTLVACRTTNRNGVGIELIEKWAEIARTRVKSQTEMFSEQNVTLEIIQADARDQLELASEGRYDFIVTSPPYWSILNKKADHKVQKERLDQSLPTRYSDNDRDLANAPTYAVFLDRLKLIFRECYRVLRTGRYIAVIVSDFRDKERFYLFHADVANALSNVGFEVSGLTVLVQDSKNLYPYGMPYSFVSNIHHQFVVIAKKSKKAPKTVRRKRKNEPTGRDVK